MNQQSAYLERHLRCLGHAAILLALASVVACSGPQKRASAPAPQPTNIVDLVRATPAPPESVDAMEQAPVTATSDYGIDRSRFIADWTHVLTKANSGSKIETGAARIVAPTATLSPSLYLEQAARSFRQAHNAIVETLPGRKPMPAPQSPGTAYAGRGFWVSDPTGRILATYADQTIYPNLIFPPGSKSYLYAPTMLGANQACIEVVTAYSSGPPAVWTWNWCTIAGPNPARAFVVNSSFVSKYVRDLGSGIGEYTVQTSQLADGKTWVAKLFNYKSGFWDELYRSSGTSMSDGGSTGWDFFEEHAEIESHNQSDYCPLLPPLFESTNVQISFDRKTFSKLSSEGRLLNENALTCDRLQFNIPDQFSHWTVKAK